MVNYLLRIALLMALLVAPCREGYAFTVQLPATGQTGCWGTNGDAITCGGIGQDGDELKGAAWPTPRFSDNSDQTLTDNLTGLIWTKNGNPAAATKTWQGALDYVASLNSESYLGYSDWRLPNRKELISLVNRQQGSSASWLNTQGFSNVQDRSYWSSSSDAYSVDYAWIVSMGYGGVHGIGKSYGSGYVWPVRGGQSGAFASLSISPTSKDFGGIPTNATSGRQTFTISNSGTATLVVSSITLTGGNSGMFALATGNGIGDTCGATPTIAPSRSCTISATFTPTSVGATSTTLRIASNDPATPNKDVALSGTGVLATYTIDTSVVGGHGSITCDSPVISGATSRCAISPDYGYHLATFTDNTVNKLASVVANAYSIPAVTSNHAIAGTFAIDSYTVTFNSNGGSAVSSQSVTYNGTATAPVAPTRTGYTFAGWYSNAALTTAFSFSTRITSNITLYAKWTISLPRTGQIKCYNTAGTEIACAGTGQDGDKLAGVAWSNPRFTDNGNGTVTDNLTGLIWLKNANCFADQAWQSALDSANRLASGSCGLSDGSAVGGWRLPNINELESLVDEQNRSSALPTGHPFSNVQASYWSSSSRASGKYAAWYLSMVDGGVSYDYMPLSYKYSFHKVWPVRDGHAATVQIPATGQTGCWDIDGADITCSGTGQDGDKLKGAAWPTPRFSDNGDQTLTDNLTGLIWAKNANPAAATKLWQGALDYIASLNSKSYLGYSDWRLPNRKELMSLVNRQQDNSVSWLNAQGFSNVQVNYYWSSSSYSNGTGAAWFLGMSDGYTGHFSKGYLYNVWPVRGGQSSLTISPASKDFGSITTNTTSSGQIFTISNRGTANLVVSSITLTGGDSGMFALATGTCGATPTIAPSGSCTISATFTPTSVGAKSTTLRIASNDPATPNKDVALSGTGVLPTYTIGTSVVGGHGSITCDSPVIWGGSSSCAISPGTGYHLATFTDNSVDKLASVDTNVYSITNVTADHAIAGTFAANAINGACGTSNGAPFTVKPTTNLCATGAASAVTGSGPWAWNCGGSNGGTTASCFAYMQGTVLLPKTGQTVCYGFWGGVIACAGTGQDGEKQMGASQTDPLFRDNGNGTITDKVFGMTWNKDVGANGARIPTGIAGVPSPRFTDNHNGTQTDNLTGLVWLKKANCFAPWDWRSALNFANTLKGDNSQCGLNDGSVAGEWRLPNIDELASLPANYTGRPFDWLNNPVHGFTNVQAAGYWSSTSNAGYTEYAWLVSMLGGYVGLSGKSYNYFVWPVRGGQSGSLGSLTIAKTGGGAGSVSSNPSRISCGAICSASFTGGQSVILSATPDSGSSFAGWTGCDSVSGTQCTVTATGAKSVTAELAISYTVSFNSNGGSAVASQHVIYNGTATAPVAPIRPGYTFDGWYSNAALTTSFSFSTPITSDITLYAKWTVSHAFLLKNNGGSVVGGHLIYNGIPTEFAPSSKTG